MSGRRSHTTSQLQELDNGLQLNLNVIIGYSLLFFRLLFVRSKPFAALRTPTTSPSISRVLRRKYVLVHFLLGYLIQHTFWSDLFPNKQYIDWQRPSQQCQLPLPFKHQFHLPFRHQIHYRHRPFPANHFYHRDEVFV